MYKQCKNDSGVLLNIIKRIADNSFIPFDEANTDYQAYLKWVEAGGVPLPADEVTV